MNIEPGLEVPSVANMIELVRLNSNRVINITVLDGDGDPIDIVEETLASGTPKGELDVDITDLSGTSIVTDYYYPKANPPTDRIIHDGVGRYSIKITSDDISESGTYLANWHVKVNESSEDLYRTQVIQVVSPVVLSLLPTFRLMIDKSLKPNIPEEYCFLGYTDSQLVMYLMQGLSYINGQPPYPVWTYLEQFPILQYSDILIRSSLYIGMTSQAMFAIDTDVPTYSDQGHSFVLQHFQPLNTMLSQLRAELDKQIPNMKRKFVRSGTASVEMRLGYMWYNLIASSPSGSLYRNFYYSG